MDLVRWRRVEELFHAALACAAAEREVMLEHACGADASLRLEVESLLAHAADAGDLVRTFSPSDATLKYRDVGPQTPVEMPTDIGPYHLVDRLGEGGMGVVYIAVDTRLGRRVAVKLLRRDAGDPDSQRRLVREARIAAGISHRLVCQVFELGEWQGQPFIAMELLEGESLATRLGQGVLSAADALSVMVSIVEAIGVLHAHGIVHRDLKPSNIFLTPAGIKVLDFGLARPLDSAGMTLTRAGAIVGTPQYAAPEQLDGSAVDARADLFSAGVMLFEMLTGRTPFTGRTLAAIIHAVRYDAPPALTGSPAVTAVDRLIHRALAKDPARRYQDATAFGADVRAALTLAGSDAGEATIRPILRLAVIPFRVLNPDREISHLGMSFADAIAGALDGLESLVVRSTMAAARFSIDTLDLAAVTDALAIDLVLSGTIVRHGDRLKIHAQLVSAPEGESRWSQTLEASIGDVLGIYEAIVAGVRQTLPLTSGDRIAPRATRPANGKAYDLYLRGMQLRMESSSWRQARTFFDQCVTLDPAFAPAWAERGRLDRILCKYGDASLAGAAETALQTALAHDPDNGPALYYYAQLEIDLGRAKDALVRLAARAAERRAEPSIYAALVHACRYNGLLAESIAAHERAQRLDPSILTSILHTYYTGGDYARALEEGHRTSDPFEARVLAAMGRDAEAIDTARREEERFAAVPPLQAFCAAFRAAFEDRTSDAFAALEFFHASGFSDGEGLFYAAEIHARVGDDDGARRTLTRSVEAGFVCLHAFDHDPLLAPVRGAAWWPALRERVAAAHEDARIAFDAAGGRAAVGLAANP